MKATTSYRELIIIILSLLLICQVTAGEIQDLNGLSKSQASYALAQDSAQNLIDFGTRLKNFFKPKSDRPVPRPIDHKPAAVQERERKIVNELTDSLENAVLQNWLLKLMLE